MSEANDGGGHSAHINFSRPPGNARGLKSINSSPAYSSPEMPRRRPHAPDALLCEHCGYDLAGLTRADNCPECGTPIAASLPENRTGTPWQRGEHRAWVRTAWVVLRHPRTCWQLVRNEGANTNQLVTRNCIYAAAMFAPFAEIGMFFRQLFTWGFNGIGIDALYGFPIIWVFTTIVGAFIFWVLTAIEVAGISHFGKRRGWRTDRTLARVICAHAGVLWTVAGAITGFALGAADDMMSHGGLIPWGALIGFLLGMLLFETWVYLGFRAMRFANPPGAERHLRDHAAPSPLGRGQGEGSLPSPQPSDTALNPPEPSSPPPVSPSDA